MLKKTIHRLIKRHHFWRDAGFDELTELYVSMMLRSLSISLTGLFVPVYLLQLHYSMTAILLIMAWYFTARALFADLLSAYTTAKIGPKHTMLIAHIMLIIATAGFLSLAHMHWPIWLLGLGWGTSSSFFFIPFHVDFSKVKHSIHGGKELGFINIMERIGSVIGPVVGGTIATLFGAQYIFLIAVLLLLFGLAPLFSTKEPVKLDQKLDYKGLNIDPLKRDFLAVCALGIENTLSIFLWPLFLALFVFMDAGVYAKLGIITSLSFVIGICAVRVIGALIDKRHGRMLLRVGTVINAVLHLFRPFVSTLPGALGVNLLNEVVTPGYRLPFVKGLYDAADDLPGYRIVYLSSIELMGSAVKATLWWFLAALSLGLTARNTMSIGFWIAALASLLVMTERFKALKPKGIV